MMSLIVTKLHTLVSLPSSMALCLESSTRTLDSPVPKSMRDEEAVMTKDTRPWPDRNSSHVVTRCCLRCHVARVNEHDRLLASMVDQENTLHQPLPTLTASSHNAKTALTTDVHGGCAQGCAVLNHNFCHGRIQTIGNKTLSNETQELRADLGKF